MSAATEAPLYERLAGDLARSIVQGTLRVGDRLPSVRRLSRQHRVSVSTVLQAYLALENQGLVEIRPQSGHFVRPFRQVDLPEPRPVKTSLAPRRVTRRTLVADIFKGMASGMVPLGAGTVSPDLLPADRLNRVLANVARRSGGAGVAYGEIRGPERLRRQLARRSLEWGSLSADDFLLTVGGTEALALALRAVTRPGDPVAVESPAWFGHLQLVESLGLKAVEIPLHPATGISLEHLERAIREQGVKACVTIPNFQNPLGSLMPDDAKRELVALAVRREVPIIEDDLYGDLFDETRTGSRPPPLKAFDREGWVMMVGAVSKTLAPGYRVGWIAAGRFDGEVEHFKSASTISSPTLPALAIAEFLQNGGYDHHLRSLRRHLSAQVAQMREELARHFPEGTRVSRPLGGFFLWVEVPGLEAVTLHQKAIERGITIAPGPVFSVSGRFANCLRINCGHPVTPAVQRAVKELGALARGD